MLQQQSLRTIAHALALAGGTALTAVLMISQQHFASHKQDHSWPASTAAARIGGNRVCAATGGKHCSGHHTQYSVLLAAEHADSALCGRCCTSTSCRARSAQGRRRRPSCSSSRCTWAATSTSTGSSGARRATRGPSPATAAAWRLSPAGWRSGSARRTCASPARP